MSFGFANANGLEDIYDLSSRWNIGLPNRICG
jgi:hypothetical protein